MFSNNKKKPSSTSKYLSEAITTIIGEDVTLKGNLNSKTSIRVDGKIQGDINSQNLIIIGEKAEITGNLYSECIIVFGTIEGNIKSTEIQIKKTGKITGDITVQVVEIEKGGKYNGSLIMNEEQILKNKKEMKANELTKAN